jgi:hypothetical protein
MVVPIKLAINIFHGELSTALLASDTEFGTES